VPWRGPVVPERLPVGQRSAVTLFFDYASPTWLRTQRVDQDGPGERYLLVDAGTGNDGFIKVQFEQETPLLAVNSREVSQARRARYSRRLPEALLRLALERPEGLEWVGRIPGDGHEVDVISIVDSQGSRTLLYVDSATHLPARAEYIRDTPTLGDVAIDTVYDDYRQVGPLRLPFSMIDRVAATPSRMYRVERIVLDEPAPADLLARPAQFVPVTQSLTGPTLHPLGNGVYEILGEYNVMFAVFGDYVLLSEAPVGEDYLNALLGLIRSVAPDLPVRLVTSHFHYDHIGGARAAHSRGIPIQTTADADEVIRRELHATRTLHADLYASSPRDPQITVAGARTVFDDGTQRVEVYDIGPTRHVAHMLVTYFPRQRTLHAADLWDSPAPEQAFALSDAELLWRKARELGLQIDRLVPAHGLPADAAQLRHGLEMRARYVPANAR
jgi:glyoxylase-like metal-dependent hydrolase (beta-lactamase superfamily II)